MLPTKAYGDGYTFEWIDTNDANNSVISFVRKGKNPEDTLVIVCNFTPVVRGNYRIGVPKRGAWREILNSDWKDFWGSGIANGTVYSEDIYVHHRHQSVSLTLPPLGVIFLKCEN
jgi:1,4-alpha-glucan branching enzyme